MSEDVKELLTEAAAAAMPVIEDIDDADLDGPTPCADFTVRELANHLHQVIVNFQILATRAGADWSNTPDVLAEPGWKKSFAVETQKLAEAWGAPDALEGVSAGMGLPQTIVAQMALLDLTLHAWDLARGTGHEFRPAPAAVDALTGFIETMAPMARKNGVFKDEVAVPEDADAFERLLGKSGRDPRWSATKE